MYFIFSVHKMYFGRLIQLLVAINLQITIIKWNLKLPH